MFYSTYQSGGWGLPSFSQTRRFKTLRKQVFISSKKSKKRFSYSRTHNPEGTGPILYHRKPTTKHYYLP